MSLTIGGALVLPAERSIAIQDDTVITLQDTDVRLRITSVAGTNARLTGITAPTTTRIIWIYNGAGATVPVGPSTTRLYDHEIFAGFTFNPNQGIALVYMNEGPLNSGFRKWIVLAGA